MGNLARDRDLTNFSERLRAALLRLDTIEIPSQSERGWLQAVAGLFGVSHAAVRKWLYGDSMPDMPHLAVIAKKCRVNVTWLATGEGDMEIVALSPDEKALVLRYRTTDARGNAILRTLAEARPCNS